MVWHISTEEFSTLEFIGQEQGQERLIMRFPLFWSHRIHFFSCEYADNMHETVAIVVLDQPPCLHLCQGCSGHSRVDLFRSTVWERQQWRTDSGVL